MNLTVVEVVLGLSFLFFLVSVVASAINEAIAGAAKLRSRTLEQGIINLLTGEAGKRPAAGTGRPRTPARRATDQPPAGGADAASPEAAFIEKLFNHSLISSYGKGDKLPSYLASRTFRNVLFDVTGLFDATAPTGDPLLAAQIDDRVRGAIEEIPIDHLKSSLLTIWEGTNRDLVEFRAGVERWFDRVMDRVGGWYKRRAQIFLFVIGLLLAFAVNADAVRAASHLWKDDGKRQSIVAAVQNQQSNESPDQAIDALDAVGFPIGWDAANRPSGVGEWGLAFLGWLITGIAVTLGAPFWFDVLNKVSNLRAAGRKPESTLLPAPTERAVEEVKLNVVATSPPNT